MTKRMLIDATHAEETRVVVLDGNRLEDYDVETSTKRQLKGNIYLAKVVRVEPSLQAAFVEYGGGRHGFLAFGEIHPDYYQIPVADRQRLVEMQAEEARREEEEEDRAAAAEEAADHSGPERDHERNYDPSETDAEPGSRDPTDAEVIRHEPQAADTVRHFEAGAPDPAPDVDVESEKQSDRAQPASISHEVISSEVAAADLDPHPGQEAPAYDPWAQFDRQPAELVVAETPFENSFHADEPAMEKYQNEPETIEAETPKRLPSRYLRSYKIQEVIKRRQILLIQVVKEERGTKGAALTTFISLAGRFCVLMPNSPRGGGISRKITSGADRRRLKEITAELAIPKGMGLIVRTAGAARPKPEIKRDCEYLMRLWDDIREHTMRSVAPAQIYEEASLIKRAIRDVYSRDVDEVIVDGEEGWRQAHEFMRMLMPSHAKKVQLWRDPNGQLGGGQPLFARHQVDVQLDAMLSPTVQLKSGGYLVLNQTEALVAIDVNSGRSTRERGIEETALRTNLEAADEVARQLRLRDLAGLIVIDFIDMESKKNNVMVERRIKDALKNDRARIQLGQISAFGLFEMSRQRLRPSLTETSFVMCPHCTGLGLVRSTESAAIQVLRAIEEEGTTRRAAEIVVYAASSIAMYIFNHKRERLSGIEQRYAMRVTFAADESLLPPNIRIDRVRPQIAGELSSTITPDAPPAMLTSTPAAFQPEPEIEAEEETVTFAEPEASDATDDEASDDSVARPGETAEESEQRSRRRRRRRRSGRREDGVIGASIPASEPEGDAAGEPAMTADAALPDSGGDSQASFLAEPGAQAVEGEAAAEDKDAQRRRGRRGGRRRRPAAEGVSAVSEPGAEQPELLPPYDGPTPANPFGGQSFDIFAALEQAEEQAARTVSTSSSGAEALPAEAPAALPEPDTAPVNEPAVAQFEAEQVAHHAADPGTTIEAPPAEAPAAEAPAEASMTETIATEPAPIESSEIESPEVESPTIESTIVETVVGPAIQPVLIGSETEAPAEKKKGWWRR